EGEEAMALDGWVDMVEEEVIAGDALRRLALHPLNEVDARNVALRGSFEEDLPYRRQGPQGANVLIPGAHEGRLGLLMPPHCVQNLAANVREEGVTIIDGRRRIE